MSMEETNKQNLLCLINARKQVVAALNAGQLGEAREVLPIHIDQLAYMIAHMTVCTLAANEIVDAHQNLKMSTD